MIHLLYTLHLNYGFLLDEGHSKRELDRALREAGIFVGQLWQTQFLPRHFEPGAYQRYRYAARTARYNRRKMRQVRTKIHGPDQVVRKPPRPLVFTGNLEDRVKGRIWPVTAQRSLGKGWRIRIRIPLPHKMQAKHAAEIVRMNREEFETLTELVFAKFLERFLVPKPVVVKVH